jgi:drug/metabolite transporter (DMT)-like permease
LYIPSYSRISYNLCTDHQNAKSQNLKNIILFSVSSLVWGSTWLAIKFQLGVVDPLVSVVYRFLLASVIILIYSRLSSLNLKFNLKEHSYLAMLGFLLFGVNYWLVYIAELYLPSGLVAIVFSLIIFLNIINYSLLLKAKIRFPVVLGAVIGMIGIVLVFKQELITFDLSSDNSLAIVLAVIGAVSASLGNIISAYIQRKKMPIVQSNAFGMLYGSLFMLIICLAIGKPFQFELSFPYIGSLLYLTIFGSIVGFSCYLTLLGNIGPDKSAYVTLVIPVIALIFSTIFEDYHWNIFALVGVVFIVSGNFIVLKKRKS